MATKYYSDYKGQEIDDAVEDVQASTDEASANTLAKRDGSGKLKVGEATDGQHATQLSQIDDRFSSLNNDIDDRFEELRVQLVMNDIDTLLGISV